MKTEFGVVFRQNQGNEALMNTESSATLGSRALFPDISAQVYANHAAISPPSLPVRTAAAEALADFARDGADAFPKWVEDRRATKAALATLLGTDSASLALVPNTTSGVLAIALCFPWNPGDRVVVFQGEFRQTSRLGNRPERSSILN